MNRGCNLSLENNYLNRILYEGNSEKNVYLFHIKVRILILLKILQNYCKMLD